MRFLTLLAAGICLSGCPKDDPLSAPFVDNFDRVELGINYLNTGGPYKIDQGKLRVSGAINHPLWLKKKLPRDAIIEFKVSSGSPDGDIKVEAWGDGQSHATSKGAYTATSYVFIFGGWGNKISALCRMDEHADNRKVRSDVKVVPGKTYSWKIKRQGSKVQWFIDGQPFLSMDDPQPLTGDGHSYFGFNNWQSDITYSELKITPL